MSRNPYILDGQEPTVRDSVFVLMDILGYSDLMNQASKNNSHNSTLRALHDALSDGRKDLEDRDLPIELQALGEKDLFTLKAFTDNIVIGWPVHSDAEAEFGNAFMRLSAFQFKMAIRGYFVRGAISVGPAYIDEIAVSGDALMESYQGESKLARDPRIILTNSAVTAAKRHIEYYGKPEYAPHVRDILKDADGQWFLNYLDTVLIAEHEHGPFYEELLMHKQAVELKLDIHKDNPPIWSKYAWVASYHNYFCDLHPSYFNDDHKIDVDLYKASPSLIIEASDLLNQAR
ncbi:hypothetical protein [Comamonas testosteroni]|uniref:hypothetical protein n=1 Tax=Comamonas testosteroni TaxID=285 RepID=UPI000A49EC7C|nr:hypothetical protein [Comamonas testosteroni]